MRIMRAVAVIVMLLLGPIAFTPALADEHAVTQAIHCFPDTWNRRDMAAFGQCFAADADFVNVTAIWWKGRPAIEKNHAFLLGTIDASETMDVTLEPRLYGVFKDTTLTFTVHEVRFLRPEIGLARVAWQITGDARTPEPRTGRMMLVVVQEGDRWRIAAVQNTEIARTVR
jgi:ketosteroid isomerase-like protein